MNEKEIQSALGPGAVFPVGLSLIHIWGLYELFLFHKLLHLIV